jgi:polyhydroxyalkanoate synthesis regulator phasin
MLGESTDARQCWNEDMVLQSPELKKHEVAYTISNCTMDFCALETLTDTLTHFPEAEVRFRRAVLWFMLFRGIKFMNAHMQCTVLQWRQKESDDRMRRRLSMEDDSSKGGVMRTTLYMQAKRGISGLGKGDFVQIAKKGSYRGQVAQVLEPSWNGRVKVIIDGATKSYLRDELTTVDMSAVAASVMTTGYSQTVLASVAEEKTRGEDKGGAEEKGGAEDKDRPGEKLMLPPLSIESRRERRDSALSIERSIATTPNAQTPVVASLVDPGALKTITAHFDQRLKTAMAMQQIQLDEKLESMMQSMMQSQRVFMKQQMQAMQDAMQAAAGGGDPLTQPS